MLPFVRELPFLALLREEFVTLLRVGFCILSQSVFVILFRRGVVTCLSVGIWIPFFPPLIWGGDLVTLLGGGGILLPLLKGRFSLLFSAKTCWLTVCGENTALRFNCKGNANDGS